MPNDLVCEIDFLCRDALGVKQTPKRFTSEWWPIARKHIRKGVVFALHEDMSKPSYLQGRLTGHYTESPNGTRVSVTVTRSDKRLPWPVGRAERGRRYKYSRIDDAAPPKPSGDALDDIGSDAPDRRNKVVGTYSRDQKIRKKVKSRAKGKCEFCGEPGFICTDGTPYLECHHIIALAKDGADRMTNVIALCPKDHREAHFGKRGGELEKKMIRKVKIIEGRQ